MNRILIDPNVRVRGDLTYTGIEDCKQPPIIGERIVAAEPESGLVWDGEVVGIEGDLVYLYVAWYTGKPEED